MVNVQASVHENTRFSAEMHLHCHLSHFDKGASEVLPKRREDKETMALIPPFFLDCVVAVGFPDEDGTKKWSASGFLYGKLVEEGSAEEKTYEIFLVTNRHVFEGLDSAFVRFNPKADAPARDYELTLSEDGEVKWHAHPDLEVDVAVIPINARFLRQQDIQFS